jgi:hypothetical protein
MEINKSLGNESTEDSKESRVMIINAESFCNAWSTAHTCLSTQKALLIGRFLVNVTTGAEDFDLLLFLLRSSF